jgi:hypothetical protein
VEKVKNKLRFINILPREVLLRIIHNYEGLRPPPVPPQSYVKFNKFNHLVYPIK